MILRNRCDLIRGGKMYSPVERELYLINIINKLKKSDLIEGIVQLGSGVIGYKDEYSDIDLMVAATEVEGAKKLVAQTLGEIGSFFIKEIVLGENIYLLIAFVENGLEFNISVLLTSDLNVKSPLWKILFDRKGQVTEKMKEENERFNEKPVKYAIDEDIAFEFSYIRKKFNTELKRNNLIYALQMLEVMRKLTLEVQAFNEEKKLHQFKAYETLQTNFIQTFLDTYPSETTKESVIKSANKVRDLFYQCIQESSIKTSDDTYLLIMKE